MLMLAHIGEMKQNLGMSEIPDFLKGIDPDTVRDLERQLNDEADYQAEYQMTAIEALRESYMAQLAAKMHAIDAYLHNPGLDKMYWLTMADEVARSHFLYYLDKIFTAPPNINVPVRLAEALDVADDTQTELNKLQKGKSRIYNMSELRTRIAEIILEDNPEKAKQAITNMYDTDIREVVLQFIGSE
jgi:hypothetical protein